MARSGRAGLQLLGLMAAVLLGSLALSSQCARQRWLQDPSFNDYVIEENQLMHSHVTSVQMCAHQCELLGQCQSFFYHRESAACHLHRNIFLPSDSLPRLYRPGARYLAAEGMVSCGQPQALVNSSVSHNGTTPGSVAEGMVSCGQPQALVNSSVSHNGTTPGSVAVFTCPENSWFFGHPSSVCSTSGQWIGGFGSCGPRTVYSLENLDATRWILMLAIPNVPLPVGSVVQLKGQVGPSTNPLFELAMGKEATMEDIPFYMGFDHPSPVFGELISGVWQYRGHSPPPGFPLAANVVYDINVTVLQAGYTVRVNTWEYSYNVTQDPTSVKYLDLLHYSGTTLTIFNVFYPRH